MATNKEAVQKIYEAFATGNTDNLDQYVSEDVVENTPDPMVQSNAKGIQYLKDSIKTYKQAFPDIKISIDETVEEGDKIVSFITCTGTNTGTIGGMPPTGKSVNVHGFDMIQFKDGKAVAHWGIFDTVAMMQQLGMMPEHAAAGGDGQAEKATMTA